VKRAVARALFDKRFITMFPLQAILADHWVKSAVHYEDALATSDASSLFERQGIDILTMALNLAGIARTQLKSPLP